MANAIYPLFKQALLGATAIDLDGGNVNVLLIDTGTTPYSGAHDFQDDLDTATVAESTALQNDTVTNGIYDADSITISSVSGSTVEALVLILDRGGASSANEVIVYLDTGITNLPFTPNGGDVTINWDASGIFGI